MAARILIEGVGTSSNKAATLSERPKYGHAWLGGAWNESCWLLTSAENRVAMLCMVAPYERYTSVSWSYSTSPNPESCRS
jgi:hypothetical protein